MFVCNFKINKSKIIKIGIIIIALLMLSVLFVVGRKFCNSVSSFKVNDEIKNDFLEINCSNYTNILKDSHENIDKYVGKKIKFTGFIYRLYDFNENQFVLAREMIISSDNQTLVVGFLSNYKDAANFEDRCWVEAEGIIEKGNYHGDLPIIKITNLKKVDKPDNEYVYPPSDSYITE